jgi:hypothetical protein
MGYPRDELIEFRVITIEVGVVGLEQFDRTKQDRLKQRLELQSAKDADSNDL